MVDSGTLTERFELQSPVRTQNDFGETIVTYANQGFRWGSIRAVRARDRLNASQISSEVSHEIIIRKSQVAIKPDWRLVLGTREFRVVEVFDADNSGDTWVMEVAEEVPV